jgi:hypothetical protein
VGPLEIIEDFQFFVCGRKKAKKLRTAYFAGKIKSFKFGSTNEIQIVSTIRLP